MALEAGQAFVDLVPRLSGNFAQDAADQVERATTPLMDRLSAKLGEVGEKLRSTGTRLTLGVTLPLVAAGAAAFSFASDLSESTSKARVVFGEMFGAVDAWAKNAATNLGISRQEALEAAGTFGNLFRSMGIGLPVAEEMSTKVVGLASDLASFNNANPTEVLDALRAGLVGETEPLRRFGVNINQARLEAKALELGLWDGESALSSSAKAQAAYALIVEDTTLAQGDFARTSDGAANKQRTLVAKLKDTAAVIGQRLLPIGEKLLGWVTGLFDGLDSVSPVLTDVVIGIGIFAAALGPIIFLVGTLATALGFILSPAGLIVAAIVAIAVAAYFVYQNWETIWPAIQRIAGEVFEWLEDHAGFLVDAIRGIIRGVTYVVDHWDEIWGQIKETAGEVLDWLVANVGPVFDVAARAVEVAMDRISDVVDVAVAVISWVWENFGANIVSIITGIWDTIVGVVEGALDIIRGVLDIFIAVFSGDWGAAWDGIKAIVAGAWQIITSLIGGALNFVTNIISIGLGAIGQLFSFVWGLISGGVGAAWETIKSVVSSGIGAVVGFIAELPGKVLGFVFSLLAAGASLGGAIIDGIKNGITGAAQGIADIATAIFATFKKGWNEVARTINDFIPDEVGFDTPFGFVGVDLPDNPIPTFHSGGIVPGRPGEEVLALLQAGERVIPAGQAGTGSVDQRTYTFVGYDTRDVLEELAWQEMTSGAA